MPVRKVQFAPKEFYHIYNRGNAKQDIFRNDKDRYRFLQAMYISNNSNSFIGVEELERNKSGHTLLDIKLIFENNKISYDPLVKVLADCLMPNHFHFIIEEIKQGGIIRFMQRLGNSYGKYFTIKYDRPGSLFQGRFKAVHIENNNQMKYLMGYVNIINPAQLIEPNLKESGIKNFEKVWKFADNYNWSTHQEYSGKRDSIIINKELFKKFFPTNKIYNNFVKNVLKGKERKMWPNIEQLSID